MSNLSRQECDLFTHACCRVTYGWDEAFPRTLSPLVTQGVIFTDSRAHFVPLRSCVMGQIGGKQLSGTSKSPFVQDNSNWVLSFSLQKPQNKPGVWMRCSGPGRHCTSRLVRPCLYEVSRHKASHVLSCQGTITFTTSTAVQNWKSAHSRKKDDASQTQAAAWGCSVCFPCSGSFDEMAPHVSARTRLQSIVKVMQDSNNSPSSFINLLLSFASFKTLWSTPVLRCRQVLNTETEIWRT